jgi:hypothetical protein
MIKKVFLSLCVLLLSGAGALYLTYGFDSQNISPDYNVPLIMTEITGLEGSAEVTFDILFEEQNPDDPRAPKTERARGIVIADDKGYAILPPMQRSFKSFSIELPGKNRSIRMEINHDTQSDKANIRTSGLDHFEAIAIEKDGKKIISKSDWAGIFSENRLIDYGINEPVKLAFAGMTIPPGVLPSNDGIIEVVIGVGGGPTSTGVNIYNPRIGICGAPLDSTDGAETFRTSTCDAARMGSHIQGTTTGTFAYNIVLPMMVMTEEFSAVMMQQMQIIGSFFDATEQNQTQRDIRTLTARAHKDYHPSETICRYGSFIRSVSHAEQIGDLNRQGLNKILNEYFRNMRNNSSAEGLQNEMRARADLFRNYYCDPSELGGSLLEFCRGENNENSIALATSPRIRNYYNKDIDVYQTLLKPLTLDVNFSDGSATPADDEQNLIALAKNLYWPVTSDVAPPDSIEDRYLYLLETRQMAAMHNVAHNTFTNIVGLKSRSDNPLGVQGGSAYMKSFLREFGISDEDIELYLGQNPSYYAQMEVLAKKIYQDPTFYTNLYDKPANIDRINASMEAIQLMQNRDRFEVLTRQEMLTSLLVEQALMEEAGSLSSKILTGLDQAPPREPTGY